MSEISLRFSAGGQVVLIVVTHDEWNYTLTFHFPEV